MVSLQKIINWLSVSTLNACDDDERVNPYHTAVILIHNEHTIKIIRDEQLYLFSCNKRMFLPWTIANYFLLVALEETTEYEPSLL